MASESKAPRRSHGAAAEPPSEELKRAVSTRVMQQCGASGRLTFAAVPALRDHYVQVCGAFFAALGRPLNPRQAEHARKIFGEQLEKAHRTSPRSRIVVSYETGRGGTLQYHVSVSSAGMAQETDAWFTGRLGDLAAGEPDARVSVFAQGAGDPATARVLDLGAGLSRNALPLARRGHPVTVGSLPAVVAEPLKAQALKEGLSVRFLEGEVTAASDLGDESYSLVVLSEINPEVSGVDTLHKVARVASRALRPNGVLLASVFLAASGFTPDRVARELARQLSSSVLTRAELTRAMDGLGLSQIDDVSVYEYERHNLPAGAYPKAPWFESWARGRDLYDTANPPVELRWVAFRKGLPPSVTSTTTTPAEGATAPESATGAEPAQPATTDAETTAAAEPTGSEATPTNGAAVPPVGPNGAAEGDQGGGEPPQGDGGQG